MGAHWRWLNFLDDILFDNIQKIFRFLWVRAKPLHFYLEKVVFLVVFFFFTKDLIYLVHLVQFLLLLSISFSKQSLFLCFRKDSWCVCPLIYLVILSNFDFSLLIVRKCQCSCVFYVFSHFHFVSFNLRFPTKIMRFLDFSKTDFLSDELPRDFDHFWKTHLIFFVFPIIFQFSRIFKKKVTFSSKRGLIYLVIMKIKGYFQK